MIPTQETKSVVWTSWSCHGWHDIDTEAFLDKRSLKAMHFSGWLLSSWLGQMLDVASEKLHRILHCRKMHQKIRILSRTYIALPPLDLFWLNALFFCYTLVSLHIIFSWCSLHTVVCIWASCSPCLIIQQLVLTLKYWVLTGKLSIPRLLCFWFNIKLCQSFEKFWGFCILSRDFSPCTP